MNLPWSRPLARTFVALVALVGLHASIPRAHAAWKVDADFRPLPTFGYSLPLITAIQSDGRFIVDSGRQRLNADGSVDPTFASPANASREVWTSPTGQLFAVYPPASGGRIALLNVDGSDAVQVPTGMPIPRISGFLPDGRAIIFGFYSTGFGTQWPAIIRVGTTGAIDPTFSSAANANDIGHVEHASVLSNGQVIIAGSFATIGGTSRNQLARLNVDGSLDGSFNAGAAISPPGSTNWAPEAIAVESAGTILRSDQGELRRYGANGQNPAVLATVSLQETASYLWPKITTLIPLADGRLVIAGRFTRVGVVPCLGLARLNANGTVDDSFNASTLTSSATETSAEYQRAFFAGGELYAQGVTGEFVRLLESGQPDLTFSLPGASAGRATVAAVAAAPGGQLAIGGRFTRVNDQPRLGLARLDADGELDATFDPGAIVSGEICTVAVQSDGKVIAGGDFFTAGAVRRNALARFNTDGSLDATFDAGFISGARVNSIVVQTDGKVLAGGRFTVSGGAANLVRFLATGALDPAFTLTTGATGTDASVNALALQTDEKFLVGGLFSAWNNATRFSLMRLNADGSLDTAFDPGVMTTEYEVNEIAAGTDGSVLYTETLLGRFGRLEPTGASRSQISFYSGLGAMLHETSDEVLLAFNYAADDGATHTPARYSIIRRFRPDSFEDKPFGLEFTYGHVRDLVRESSGAVLVAGSFVEADGMDYAGLMRLLPATPEPTLANISTRGYVGVGDETLIAGFYVSGGEPQRVVIRGIGTNLAQHGVTNFARNTTLHVFRTGESTPLAANAGWYQIVTINEQSGVTDNNRLSRAFDRIQAFSLTIYTTGFGTSFSNDAALLLDLPPGGYTVHLGAEFPGVGLVEVYDANGVGAVRKLINISTRGRVGTGAEQLIAGFIVDRGTKRVLIRAVGPSVAHAITGTLADPVITLVRQSDQATIATNDNWGDATNAAEIATVTPQVSGLPLAADSADAAMLVDLPAGSYTVVTSGVGDTTGIALVEVYEVPTPP